MCMRRVSTRESVVATRTCIDTRSRVSAYARACVCVGVCVSEDTGASEVNTRAINRSRMRVRTTRTTMTARVAEGKIEWTKERYGVYRIFDCTSRPLITLTFSPTMRHYECNINNVWPRQIQGCNFRVLRQMPAK